MSRRGRTEVRLGKKVSLIKRELGHQATLTLDGIAAGRLGVVVAGIKPDLLVAAAVGAARVVDQA